MTGLIGTTATSAAQAQHAGTVKFILCLDAFIARFREGMRERGYVERQSA